MCFFDGTEGIVTVLPRVQIWCTVAGLICFLVSLKRIGPFLALFLCDIFPFCFKKKFHFPCRMHEHFYRLKLFRVFGRVCCFFLVFFAFKIPFERVLI